MALNLTITVVKLAQRCSRCVAGLHYNYGNLNPITKRSFSLDIRIHNKPFPSKVSDVLNRPKTRQPVKFAKTGSSSKICTTYATADHYQFYLLIDHIERNTELTHIKLPNDIVNAVVFQASQSILQNDKDGYVIIFKVGAVSFWNIKESAVREITQLCRPFEVEPYPIHLIAWENERINYKIVSSPSRFIKNLFEIIGDDEKVLNPVELYAFSNALILSVKLAHWEHALDKLIKSIETLPRELINNKKIKDADTILSKIGEVFLIRHKLNLEHNLLELPDVYWDREELEPLFTKTTKFLNISRRVRIMNEKLSYCAHVIELVKSHLGEQKSIRVEILIVVLILIEVVFEILHLFVLPYID